MHSHESKFVLNTCVFCAIHYGLFLVQLVEDDFTFVKASPQNMFRFEKFKAESENSILILFMMKKKS